MYGCQRTDSMAVLKKQDVMNANPVLYHAVIEFRKFVKLVVYLRLRLLDLQHERENQIQASQNFLHPFEFRGG
jgi:hypothetical protein